MTMSVATTATAEMTRRGPSLRTGTGSLPRWLGTLPIWLGLLLWVVGQAAPVLANSRVPEEFHRVDDPGWSGARGLPALDPTRSLLSPDRVPITPQPTGASPGLRHSSINIPNHPAVSKYIDHYQGKGRRTFAEALNRSLTHLPEMMAILEQHGVPPELVYIALVESRFRVNARSQQGAAGPWQLMAGTARSLGLKVGNKVDERLNPVKSTRAAAEYLSDLYLRFGSWPLVLAAYNAGGEVVAKALDRVEVETYWELHQMRRLSVQTWQFVPKVLAAIHVARNLERYGFERKGPVPEPYAVYRGIQDALSLKQISSWTGVPVSGLRQLNPGLDEDHIPAGQGFDLRLPLSAFDDFSRAYQRYARSRS